MDSKKSRFLKLLKLQEYILWVYIVSFLKDQDNNLEQNTILLALVVWNNKGMSAHKLSL